MTQVPRFIKLISPAYVSKYKCSKSSSVFATCSGCDKPLYAYYKNWHIYDNKQKEKNIQVHCS
jgi:hypothetical protein